MFRKRKKHEYLRSGGEVPRSTFYDRTRKSRKEVTASQSNAEMVIGCSETSDKEFSNPNAILTSGSKGMIYESLPGNNSGSDCSDEISASVQSSPQPVESDSECGLTNHELTYHDHGFLLSQMEDSEGEESGYTNEAHQSSDGENCTDEGEALEETNDDMQQMTNPVTIAYSSDDQNGKDPLLNTKLCPCSPTTAGDALLYSIVSHWVSDTILPG